MSNAKNKRGDRCLPRNNYIWHCYVQTNYFGAKVHNKCVTPKENEQKNIAKAINVDLSTIYRELKRNSGSRNHYNRETAEANARRKKRRTPGNRRISQEVREEALRLLKEKQCNKQYNLRFWRGH